MKAGMPADSCVIVSYYDGRPSNDLIALLRSLTGPASQPGVEIRVVVNSDLGRVPTLPADLNGTNIDVRENTGFNIGAWDHGWRHNPGFGSYLFLQDECQVSLEGWLQRYRRLLSERTVGIVCESLMFWKSWAQFQSKWPEAYKECVRLGVELNIPLGSSPTHAQTLALGASAACLNATDGFLTAQGKVAAIATEIMFSRHCIDRGFRIVQSAWRPFEYFPHPQWASIRDAARGPAWHASRAMNHLRRK